MAGKKSTHILFWTTVLILITCMITIGIFCGYYHSTGKFRAMLLSVCAVLLFHYLAGDPIKFALLAINASLWSPEFRKFSVDKEATHHNRLDYLQLRLQSLRASLYIPEKHRDEQLNNKYKQMAQDLWLHGRYFVFLMSLVLVSCNEHTFHTSKGIEQLLRKNNSVYFGLDAVHDITDVYEFITSSLINAFEPDASQPGVSVWEHAEQTVLLGVVRLRQLRSTAQHYGINDPPFSEEPYMPQWKLPYQNLPYSNTYWRIYHPWVPRNPNVPEHFWMNFDHNGYFRRYPELKGYLVLLARSRQNNLKIIEYLRDNKWLNYNTSAIFIDFTLYSIDEDILNLCSIRVEQTPFGSTIPHVHVESLTLFGNFDQLSGAAILLFIGYAIMFIQFFKNLMLKIWHEPSEIRSFWNVVDVGIFLLNIILFILIIMREAKLETILKFIEGASKMEFVEFRHAARVHRLITVVIGFLIFITTLRLCKVLQLFSGFQLFTYTLYVAWTAVASVAMVLCIFIFAFGLAVHTINGNNSFNFYRLSRSIVTCTCFAFGFSVGVNPEDLFYGGVFLGIILFAILAFVFSALLLNVFVSVINDYFATAKDQQDTQSVRHISIFQFIYAEYIFYILWWQKFRVFRKYYHRKNRTVAENIKLYLGLSGIHRKISETQNSFVVEKTISQIELDLELEQFREKQEQMYTTGAILNTQVDILKELLKSNKNE